MRNAESLGSVLRDLRSKLKLSQEELAARLNVSFATVNRWENDKATPQGAARDAISKLLEEAGGEPLVARDTNAVADGGQPRRRKRGTARSAVLSTKSMEQMLWDAACSIRGEKDAPKFKDYLLPLIFIKRLSDVFDDEVKRLVETYGDLETANAVLDADHSVVRFYLPPECRWAVVSRREQFKWPKDKAPKTLGEQLTMTVRAIAKANSDKLAGVIDIVDFNAAPHGEREISDAALSGVIETFSDPRYRLGLRDVEPDFLGRAYEYLLRKFAESQGQSAGEFFTPQEVGWIMAYIVRPRQGEEACDFACGSAGLLIKCELALVQRDRKVSSPLKLYGQELTGSSYAIARMNMVIHDMEGEIVRGNSMTNPKFRDNDTSLKKFDIAVANPMWNQPFDEKTFENDPFDRFDSRGGNTSGKGDWAWLQHTVSILKENGRAAVVLDTGAVTRGSGSKNEDKERNIRKWFVEQDLIDGVILLPENLFYNTTAAGIIIVLRKNKSKGRRGKITLVNASAEFKKGQPKNYIPDDNIRKIADAFNDGKEVDGFVKVITTAEAAKSDFNLSPSRYLATGSMVNYRQVPALLKELGSLDKEAAKISRDLLTMLRKATAREHELFESKLPAGWLWETISTRYRITKKPKGRILSNFATIPFVPMESVPLGGREDVRFELRRPTDIASGTYFEKGDVLLSKITPSFENGKQALANNIPAPFGVASTEIIPLQAITPEASHRYLFFYLLHPEVRAALVGKMEGSTGRQRVPEGAVREFPVPMPPKPVQDKIAVVLWKVQRALETQERLTATARELKQSAMRQLFTRGLRNESQKETDDGTIPKSWLMQPIRANAKLIAGGTPRGVKEFWTGGTIPWVKTGEVDYCVITQTEEKITPVGLENSAARILPKGSLLIAMYGQGITRGKVAILGIDAATNQACAGIIPTSDKLKLLFLYYYLTFSYDRLRSFSHGAQQQNLNAELVGSFHVPLADPDEQIEIATILQTIDRKISVHERKRAALSDLFQTLLNQLMTAQIRVDKLDIDTSEVAALNPQAT